MTDTDKILTAKQDELLGKAYLALLRVALLADGIDLDAPWTDDERRRAGEIANELRKTIVVKIMEVLFPGDTDNGVRH